jgi:hypothetical protein
MCLRNSVSHSQTRPGGEEQPATITAATLRTVFVIHRGPDQMQTEA